MNRTVELVNREGVVYVGKPAGRSHLSADFAVKPDERSEAGEPGRSRTFNQQIKSLLLCQLSYRSVGRACRRQAIHGGNSRGGNSPKS
jgi:hypothetical protein